MKSIEEKRVRKLRKRINNEWFEEIERTEKNPNNIDINEYREIAFQAKDEENQKRKRFISKNILIMILVGTVLSISDYLIFKNIGFSILILCFILGNSYLEYKRIIIVYEA